MKKADLGVVFYVLSAFIMLIVPISSGLLDVLLACNMAVAFSVLFSCMFANEVLKMSFYPTILLFTTIFR
ncbi:MAG: EscV/YscV/HrcV family type III secretion system export apparatus protein, partial [Lachnospiraceae bacterium]|nr:EscV/YscV/HrcV family type III secretion system export apparatus protein [Lachnospiraceae bacterium]